VCYYLSLSSRENDRDGGVLRVKLQTAADDGITLLYIKLYYASHRGAREVDSSAAERWNRLYDLRHRRHCFIITILVLHRIYTPAIIYNNTTFSFAQRAVEKFIGL